MLLFVDRLLFLTIGLRALRSYPKRIASYAEARSIAGVGDKTALKASFLRFLLGYPGILLILGKIMEILQTGELRRVGYERTEDVMATKVFQGIYGVGAFRLLVFFAPLCFLSVKSGMVH
jgi:DNA polymerase lambda